MGKKLRRWMVNNFMRLLIGILICFSIVSCTNKTQETSDKADQPPVPVVNDNSKGLVFTWPADGGFAVADRVSDVPSNARKEVRVQDPSLPPEAADWVFFADLTSKLADGKYKVRAITRETYQKKLRPPPPPPPPSEVQQKVLSSQKVIMYMTPHCPVCRTARKWLRNKGIIFVEKNLEKDPEAAKELQEKAQKQGVGVQGVPVFDVNGKIVSGFDEQVLLKLLGNPQIT